MLAELYGSEYSTSFADTYVTDSPRDTAWVLGYLSTQPRGTFVDYGCGGGDLLAAVSATGWKVYGVEIDSDVARRTSAATGCEVLLPDQLDDVPLADVLHLGDVLEHLPDPSAGMQEALRLLAPKGTLLAQGPLELGPSLFSAVIRPGRRRHADAEQMPPYHLIQATAHGQREFFQREGLEEESYRVSEVDWPAPSRLSAKELTDVRRLTLFALRRTSNRADRIAAAVTGRAWGNRFQYVGIAPGPQED